MLKKLVGKKFVKTSTLMKELRYGDRSTLSREKRKLNENLCTNLELPQDQDVILGGNKRKYKGYQINPLYIVKIVKKGC